MFTVKIHNTEANFTIILFNVILALIFIVAAFPLLILLAVLIRMRNNGPVLYKGVRLGLHKRPFYMYKFRTLPVSADEIIGPRIFTPEMLRIKRSNQIIRDTRLDELPQLFNILKGDMDFIGPRPVRPEIYEKHCKQINNYDVRFEVKPGLIGVSQLFTPYSAPKRVRSLIDNKYIHQPRRLSRDLIIILFTFIQLFKMTLVKTFNYFWTSVIECKILHKYVDKRNVFRIRQKKASVYFKNKTNDKFDYANGSVLFDINESSLKMYSNQLIGSHLQHFLITTEISAYKKRKRRNAHCLGKVTNRTDSNGGRFKYAYIVSYKARTKFNRYMIDKYFLEKSILYANMLL